MPTTLHLTATEHKLFVSLPKEVTKGMKVVREERGFEDSVQQQHARRATAKFQTPALKSLHKKLATVNTEDGFMEAIEGVEISELPDADVRELFFVLGPEALSLIISKILQEASTTTDIEQIADLTAIRSTMLNAFASVP